MIRLFKHYVPHTVLLLGLIDFALLFLAAEGGWLLRNWQVAGQIDPSPERIPQMLTCAITLQLAMVGVGVYALDALWSMRIAVARLVVSISLGVALYMGSRRLNLRQFFTATGILLIVFAAGLLAHGIHEFQEGGLLSVTIEHVWDTNGLVSEDSNFGLFLKALFGYNGNPSLLEVVAWLSFLGVALAFFLRPLVTWRRESTPAQV